MKSRPDLLLVDDDPSVLRALNRILQEHANVRSTTSGETAISLIEQSPIDLLMLDLDMPGMNGFDVLAHLKREHWLERFPVVVLSGHKEPGIETRVLDSGAADFLSKPFTPSHVLARVRAQLQLRRAKLRTHRLLESAPGGRAPSILIVDDDPRSLHSVHAALRPLGAEVRFAVNAGDALRTIDDTPPDLIMLDIQLPDASGFELCETLRDDPLLNRIPIMVITRFDDEISEARACELGATDFVSKACSPALLLARVRKILRFKAESDALLSALDRHWQQLTESRTALVMDEASDAMLSIDASGRVVLINRAACALLEVEHDVVLRQPLDEVFRDREGWETLRDQMLKLAHQADNADPDAGGALLLRNRHDEVRHIEPRFFRINDHGSPLVTVAMRDVTDREVAARLQQDQVREQADRRARAMTMSCIVHELGNPLNGILGFAQLMLKDQHHSLQDINRQRVEHLLAAAGTLQKMMGDLRDASLLEQGRFKVERTDIDLLPVVDAVVGSVQAAAANAGIELRWVKKSAPAMVAADPDRVKQCLANLLTNAIKYNRPGGRVDVTLNHDAGHVAVCVADTGLGMRPEQMDRLFRPFERLGQETTATPGTGLGLAISKMLANAMGGRLTASSQPGVGSTFELSLPASALDGA